MDGISLYENAHKPQFTGEQCDFWLAQMTWAQFQYTKGRYFNEDTVQIKIDNVQSDFVTRSVTLGLSITFLTAYYFLTWLHKLKVGYSHILLTVWMVLQWFPMIPLFLMQSLHRQNIEDPWELTSRVNRHLLVVQWMSQFSTMTLVIMVWLVIGAFKRVEVQVVKDDQETTYNMFQKLKFLRRYQQVFIFTLLIFETPMMMYSAFQILEIADYKQNFNFQDQYYSAQRAALTTVVDVLIMMFFVIFLANVSFQLISLDRLMRFLTDNKVARVSLYCLVIPLTMLYVHNIFSMLIYYWGTPAI